MALVSDHRFYAGPGQGNAVTTAALLISFLDDVNRIYKFTDFGGDVGVGVQLAISQIVIFNESTSAGNPFQDAGLESNTFLNQLSVLNWY